MPFDLVLDELDALATLMGTQVATAMHLLERNVHTQQTHDL
jgi:hypothetical protein